MQLTSNKLLIILFPLFVILSCNSKRAYEDNLNRIENLIENDPQSANEKLDILRPYIFQAPEADQMRFALLEIMTKDKLFLQQESDSTMLVLTDYFEENGTDEERLYCYYLLAAAYRDMHDSPKAIEYYLKATSLGEKTDRLKYNPILVRSYGQLANILSLQCRFAEALDACKQQYVLSKTDNHDVVHELGEAYLENGKNDSATIYFDLARKSCLSNEQDPRWIIELVGSQLGQFVTMGDSVRADECHKILTQYPDSIYTFVALSSMGWYQNSKKKYDLAYYYWSRSRELAPTWNQRHSMDVLLMKVCKELGKHEETISYAYEIAELSDSIYSYLVLQQSSNKYNHYIYSQNKQKEILERQRIWKYSFIGYFILSIVIILTLWLYNRNKERLRNTIEVQGTLLEKNHELTEAKTLLEKQLHEQYLQHKEIDTRALAHSLYMTANQNNEPTPLSKEQLRLVHYAVELNFPEIVNKINNIFFGITPFDRSLLYILKLGLNQSEAARLLNRKRSTISHRLAILEKTYQIAPKSILEIDGEFVRDLHQNETLS